jgi:outer membrane receptor protein involved in Fe transport
MKKHLLCILLLLALPTMAFAQGVSGKISGRVVDQATGEPLIRASVRVLDSRLGALTDLEGNYTILNVPVGVYVIKATYVGYTDVIVEGVKVTTGLTTKLDFTMGSKETTTKEITITATRPLVEGSATTKTMVISAEQIQNTPARGAQAFVGLQAGVIRDDKNPNNIYIRGGRRGEVAFYVDGVLQNNPINNSFGGNVSNDAIQEIVVQTSFDAEYGNAASGIVNVSTKDPTIDKYSISSHIITDAFLPKRSTLSNQFGGYGYNLGNVSVSGPLVPGFKELSFYGLFEVQDQKDQTPTQGFGVIEGNDLRQYNGVYKLRYNLGGGIDLKLGGNFTRSEFRGLDPNVPGSNGSTIQRSGWDFNTVLSPDGTSYIDIDDGIPGTAINNATWTERSVSQTYLRFTQALTEKSYITVQGQYSRSFTETMDYSFRRDFASYFGQYDFDSLRVSSNAFGLFNNTGFPRRAYTKELIDFIELRGDYEAQFANHNVKLGGQFRYHTYKYAQFDPSISPISNIDNAIFIGYKPDEFGYAPLTAYYNAVVTQSREIDPVTRLPIISGQRQRDDITVFDSRLDDARNPIFASLYIRDQYSTKEFNVNFGLRLDYLDANTPTVKDLADPLNDEGTDVELEDSKKTVIVQPRLSFSFPISEQTVFHASYGKFAQMPQLQYLYDSKRQIVRALQEASGTAVNPNLKPEVTNSYEIGFQQQLGNATAIDVTAFYKETSDLIQIIRIEGQGGLQPQYFGNQDFGTIRGVDITVRSQRFDNLNISASYTLQFAGGTNTSQTELSNFYRRNSEIGFAPTALSALSFDQRHTGNVNVDYRIALNDQSMPSLLRGVGVNALLTFNSGRPYTPATPNIDWLTNSFSATREAFKNTAYGPWNYRLDMRIDKQFQLFDRLNTTVYLWGLNVLGTLNEIGIYPTTGNSSSTGFLDTREYQARINDLFTNVNSQRANLGVPLLSDAEKADIERRYRDQYNARQRNPANFGLARQFRLGLMLNF